MYSVKYKLLRKRYFALGLLLLENARLVWLHLFVMSRFPIVDALLDAAIHERAFPGASYGVLFRGQRWTVASRGSFTYQPESAQVQPDTVFDMASVSKVMATTAMAMLLWQRGQLDLDEPVGSQLPEFLSSAGNVTGLEGARQAITVRMLLSHCSGLPAYAPLYETCKSASLLLDACLRMPLEAPPETGAVYSDIGFIVLGHLLETIAGESLDVYCAREIFGPLAMSSTLYRPPDELKPLIPPTGVGDGLRPGVLQGEVNDGNCWMLGGVSGHAGVFSSVPDILRFAECIVGKSGTLFHPKTISQFTARQNIPAATEWALGWDTPTAASSSGQFFSSRSVGHLGYTGTSLWIDFDKDLAVVLLTNRTYPDGIQAGASKKIQRVRPLFHDAVVQALI